MEPVPKKKKTKHVAVSMMPEVHAKAVAHARNAHGTDLSSMITRLILDDLRLTQNISTLRTDVVAAGETDEILDVSTLGSHQLKELREHEHKANKKMTSR